MADKKNVKVHPLYPNRSMTLALLDDSDAFIDTIDPTTGLPQPSATEQHHKDSCDINNIMKLYQDTGQLPGMIQRDPTYGDFSNIPTFEEAHAIIQRANEQFNALPAELRAELGDARGLIAFVSNPENRDRMKKYGMLKPDPEPEKIQKVEVVNTQSKEVK